MTEIPRHPAQSDDPMSEVPQVPSPQDDPMPLTDVDPAVTFEERMGGVTLEEATKIARRFLLKKCRDNHLLGDPYRLAEDLAQETMLKVWRSVCDPNYRVDRPAGFVRTVAMRIFLDRYRESVRDGVRSDIDDEVAVADGQNTAGDVVTRSVADTVEGWIADLNEECQQVARLLWDRDDLSFDSMSYQKVADRLGIPVGTVKSRMNSMKKKFQEKYRKELGSHQPESGQ